MANPNTKGSAFERKIAKALSLWVDPNDAHIFARRSGSGGARRDKSGDSGHAGDIFADKAAGHELLDFLTFELKFYKDLSGDLWHWLAGEPSKIWKFIHQAKESAEPYDRYWAVIIKSNRRETLMLTNFNGIRKHIFNNIIARDNHKSCITLINFDDFIKTDSYKVIDELQKYHRGDTVNNDCRP